jgi:HD-GYP domain-containing protein (c-di-GMP phosphodiesterase class II)
MTFRGEDGHEPFLRPHEAAALQIRRGSLTDEERKQINDHVVHSIDFLSQIPWSRALREVPNIAGAHHEKMDGTGYPKQLRGDQIPVAARMMAIADIYDALTAQDRPYKKAMPPERALAILEDDVTRGQLDRNLFDIFCGARVWSLPPRERK